jgi:hypothetical protein
MYVINVNGEEIDHVDTLAKAKRARNTIIYGGIGTEDNITIEKRKRDLVATAFEVNGVMMLQCEWFAKCTNGTLQVVDHPILGQVPACKRCIGKSGGQVGRVHDIQINVS